MVQPFAGQPPDTAQTVQQPQNRAPNQAQVVGSGGTLKVNADGSLNVNSTASISLPPSTTMTQVVINATANGDNTLVAGVAAKTVKVYQMVLAPASVAVNGLFKSGTASAISGTMVLSTTESTVLNFSPYPWLLTAAGDGLLLNLSSTASVGGFASVVQS